MLEAIFNDYVNVVTVTGLTQWDKGRILTIKGLDLPETVEVHFADKINTIAIRMIGTKQNDYTVVEVPDVVVENSHDIHAWVYVTDKNELNKNESKTKKSIYLKVEPRAKPQDFTSENLEGTLSQILDVVNKNIKDNQEFKEEIIQDNNQFKQNMVQSFNELTETSKQNIEKFKNQATKDLTNFKNRIEEDNTTFKTENEQKFNEYYEELKSISQLNTIQTGMISQYAGQEAPNGYLMCQGQEVSRTTYEKLFKVIGSIYGNGDGSTTFNVPNLKGRVPVGLDSTDNDFKTLGKKSGEKTHRLTVDEIPSHVHSATTTVNNAGAHTHGASASDNGWHSHSFSGSTNSGGYHGHSTYYLSDLTNSKADSRRRGVESANSGNSADNVIAGGSHTHSFSGSTGGNGTHSHTITVNSGGAHNHGASTNIGNSGGGQVHNNLQPYIVLNYIIKY